MKKVLSVLLALCLLLGSVPMFALAEEGDGQEPPRLHVYHGIDYDHWDDELGKDVFSYNPDAGHDPFWGTLPIDNQTVAFGIETENGAFKPVPVSSLTGSQGLHITPIPAEQIAEGSRQYAQYMAFVTVDDFGKEYTISYQEGGTTYEMRFDTNAYGMEFYTKPDLDYANITHDGGFNVAGDPPTVYLGVKEDPQWQGSRRIKSIELGVRAQENFTMEKVSDTFWKITMKKEAMLKDTELGARVLVQWEHEEGPGNWVNDDGIDDPSLWFYPRETIAYSTTDIFNGKDRVLLKDVQDKLSVKLDMTVGDKKTIYPIFVATKEIDGREQWYAEPMYTLSIDTTNTAVVTTDVIGFTLVTTVKPSVQIIAAGAGSATLRYSYWEYGILDESTGNFLTEDEEWVEYLLKKYPDLGEFGTDWTFDGWNTEILTAEDGSGSQTRNLVITTKDGELRQALHSRRWHEAAEWPECGITVNVKSKPAVQFTDVKSTDYYADAVGWAVENGITAGKGNNTFKPNDKRTRGEIVTFLWRSAGSPEPKTTVNPFKDVKEKDFYYKAVLWAVENDITAGKGEGTFKPGDKCTRGEAVTFMWRAEGEPAAGSSGAFKDVASGAFYEKAVGWAVENSITAGKGEGTFKPSDKCSRAEIVSFLYRGRNL